MNLKKNELTFNLSFDDTESEEFKGIFAGIAYSGGVAEKIGLPPMVFDLSSTSFPETIPVFRDHDHSQIVGQASLYIEENVLKAKGKVLDATDHGVEVRKLAKSGFKWQMSIGVISKDYRELAQQDAELINGHEFSGPGLVLSQNEVYEVSFVAVGADSNTSAQVLNKNKEDINMDVKITEEQVLNFELGCSCTEKPKASVKEIAAIAEKVPALEAELAQAKETISSLKAELKKYKKKEKKMSIIETLSSMGLESNDEKIEELTEMDEEGLALVMSALTTIKSIESSVEEVVEEKTELSKEMKSFDLPEEAELSKEENKEAKIASLTKDGMSKREAIIKVGMNS